MKNFVLALLMLFGFVSQCSAQCVDCGPSVIVSEYPVIQYAPAQYVPTAINWNQECAIQSAQQFAQCKASGGGRWACLAQAGLNYWTCSGSTFETAGRRGGLRAVATGMRAVRAGR